MKYSLDLRIERLVLEGFPQGERQRINEAVQQELVRLFTEQGIPPHLARGGAVGRLDGGAFTLPQGANPERLGIQVAQAIYDSLRDTG